MAWITEQRWRQRSRVTWLHSGDTNTRFFHAYASARARKNTVAVIQHEDRAYTDKKEIVNIFSEHMRSVLGTEGQVLDFELPRLYSQPENLQDLQSPFLEAEIEATVKQLALNNAFGPDGLPSEFVRNFWPLIKADVLQIFEGFYHNRVGLEDINKANIVFIPKRDKPEGVGEFRPISIINIVPKLISKVLSNRLRPKLPELISPQQTAFVKKKTYCRNLYLNKGTPSGNI